MSKVNIFWFRRDLRFHDNTALHYAMQSETPLLPIFIFDLNILEKLPKQDARVEFILSRINGLKTQLEQSGRSLKILHTTPEEAFEELANTYKINEVFCNRDYEPYALRRDQSIEEFLIQKGISFYTFKDHVVYEKEEIVSDTGTPYKVYTPFSRKWKKKYADNPVQAFGDYSKSSKWFNTNPFEEWTIDKLGFRTSGVEIPSSVANIEVIKKYDLQRNFPAIEGTTRLGIHLRFGTVGIREMVKLATANNEVWLNELIWREFYIQVLANFPYVVEQSFKKEYDAIPWRNNEDEFKKWCQGQTGYPIVDAGMRELNATGFMHNRVRMITASFLTKHLLIDWRWGEAYFAEKLLDFELASNNGGWQWAAGTGTDAQPYFRVFNPQSQTEKFDTELKYIKKWVPEYADFSYPKPIVEHKFARLRAIETYKTALGK